MTQGGLRFLGSIALAPGLGSVHEWATLIQNPSRPVGMLETFAAMSLYAHMLYAGEPESRVWLSASARTTLPTLFHDQCLLSLVSFPSGIAKPAEIRAHLSQRGWK